MTNPYEAPLSTSPATDGPIPIDLAGLPSPGGIKRFEYVASNIVLFVLMMVGVWASLMAALFSLAMGVFALAFVGHFYIT